MRTPVTPPRAAHLAVTLLELMVVVLIVSILATVATGVYTEQSRRARIAATEDLINQLEMAITRYEVDLGDFPPSGSSSVFPPGDSVASRVDGSGLLQLALVHSMSGNSQDPASSFWNGPYITVQHGQIALGEGGIAAGNYNFLDGFGTPIVYVRSQDYSVSGAKFTGGTRLFSNTPLDGANSDLPAPNPYLALGETYYNPTTYQIISLGPDGVTLDYTVPGFGTYSFKGAGTDDINNF